MATLVRSGKIRYWGLSNFPAWLAAKIAALATMRGQPGPIALKSFYSLANRDIEDEHMPMAAECGMGIVPWSPLAFGLLTGRYDRATVEAASTRAAGLPRVMRPLLVQNDQKATSGSMVQTRSVTRCSPSATGRSSTCSKRWRARPARAMPVSRWPGSWAAPV
jgi:aryl-alcohol dehydrogenase-like predicted oxidoreductase